MDFSKKSRWKFSLGGFGMSLAIISKIQAYSFSFLLLIRILTSEKKKIRSIGIVLLGFCGGAILIFLGVAIHDGLQTWTSIFEVYFYRGVATAQYSGRAMGGLPPLHKLFLTHTVCLSFLGALLPLIFKRFRALLWFGSASLVQAISLLLIYLITQRGGPLIINYWLDSHVLGLVSFAGCAALYLKESGIALFQESLRPALFLMFMTVITIILHGLILSGDEAIAYIEPYWPYFWAVVVTLFLSREFIQIPRNRWTIFAVIFVLFFVIEQSKVGVERGFERVKFAEPYHKLARFIQEGQFASPVWISVSLNRPKNSDGTKRLKKIFQTFYDSEPSKKDLLMFQPKPPPTFDFLITDSSFLIIRFSKRKCTPKKEKVYLIDRKTGNCTIVLEQKQ